MGKENGQHYMDEDSQKAPKQQPNPPPRAPAAAVNARPRENWPNLPLRTRQPALVLELQSLTATTGVMTSSWRLTVACRVCKSSRQTPAPGAATRSAARRTTTGKRIPYTAEQIDFVVAYVGQEDAWYVIPLHAFAPRRHLQLYPSGGSGRGNTKYEKFREAWHLMKADQRGPARDS